MDVDRWQHQLSELLAAVHAKQRQYDQAIIACQQLLKPWPRKTKESEPSVKKDVASSKNSETVSPREAAELRVVENLLKKAHKTRINTSQKLKQQVHAVDDDLLTSKNEKELWEICDTECPNIQESVLKEDTEPLSLKLTTEIKTDESKQNDDSRNKSTVGQNEQATKSKAGHKQNANFAQESRSQSSSRSDRSSSSGRGARSGQNAIRSGGKLSTSTAAMKWPKSMDGKVSSRQPVTLTESKSFHPSSTERSLPASRPGSSGGRFKPAHTVAPFKTDSNVRIPKRSVKNSIIRPPVRQPHTAGRQLNASKGDRNRVLPPISSGEEPSSDVPVVSGDGEEDGDIVPDASNKLSRPLTDRELEKAFPQQSSSGNRNVTGAANQTGSINEEINSKLPSAQSSSSPEDVLSKMSDLALQSASFQDGPSNVSSKAEGLVSGMKPTEDREVKLFSLLTEGNSVPIPLKMRRAFARNQQLKDKLLQHRSCKKDRAVDEDLGLRFADRLEDMCEVEGELVCRHQCLQCLRSHQQLTSLLTGLQLDNITESSSVEDILRAKKLAEFVLSAFSQLSDQANMFSKVDFGETPAVVEPSLPQRDHPYIWLPPALSEGNVAGQAGRLVYKNKAELSLYMNETLRVQSLVCQRHLLEILVSDLLPWLQQQDFSSTQDFGTIFRGLCSLLTSDGNHRPVLICDPV